MPTPKQANEQVVPVGTIDVVQQRRDKIHADWDVLLSTILQRWDLIPKNFWDRRQGTFDELVDVIVEQYKVDRDEAVRQVDYWLSHQYRAD